MYNIPAHLSPWHPDKPVSKGASAYHDAVVNAPYYIENLNYLIKNASQSVKENDVVVDFGAGTGVSAINLLKKLKFGIRLLLVDNSAAWLGKAHEIFSSNPNVQCFLLQKIGDRYSTLAETIGNEVADYVMSANTFHLVPDIMETFKGIHAALKPKGIFSFQSGNIVRSDREKGILMIDDTIKRVHDIALEIVRTNKKFAKYANDIGKNIEREYSQRKFVFPDPRPVDFYLRMLKESGFSQNKVHCELIKIAYKDWLDFLRVKRLQAGILPEIGGKEPSPEEEHDRDELITMASSQLFRELKEGNPFADDASFTAEWVYITAAKNGV